MKYKLYTLFFLLPVWGFSQSMVKDINNRQVGGNLVLSDRTVTINNTVYFAADDGINGVELWKTDGTASGTVMVKDIYPGPSSSGPDWLTEMNGIVYFAADDGVHGVELWKSDGTTAGTVLVKNIVASNGHSSPRYLVNNNGTLYFGAGGEPNLSYLPDRELWKSDGTAAGTGPVSNNIAASAPLVASGNYLYFNANASGFGNELHKTDGLTTELVKDIQPSGSSSPRDLTDVNGTLFFTATDNINGRELWKSDGTAAGTQLVKAIYPGTESTSNPSHLVNFNGTLFFTADDDVLGRELWKSDGTEAGTVIVKDIYPGSANSTHSGLRVVGNTLFFSGRGTAGTELYKSDGTAAGTVQVKDIFPNTGSSDPTYISPIALSSSPGTPAVIFLAGTNAEGRELWVSDGTDAGTSRIRNIRADNEDSDVEGYVFSNGNIYFSARTTTQGRELWKSDGTPAGTVLVKDLNPGSADGNPRYLTNYGGFVYFSSLSHLWRTDGTTAGTVVVKADISPQAMIVHNGLLYLAAGSGTIGTELWRSDGTDAGTYLVKDIRPGGNTTTRNSNPQNFHRVGNTLLFTAIDATGTRQVWKTDGTEAGTVKIVPATPITAMGSEFAVAGNLLFFTAQAATTGTELWRTDGTDAGTFIAKNIFPEVTPGIERDSDPKFLTAFGNMVLFTAQDGFGDGSTGRELWRSDGTNAGTVMVKDINNTPVAVSPPVEGGSFPASITVVGSTAYFYAYTPALGRELWKTDGTNAGTVAVMDVAPGSNSGIPGDFTSLPTTAADLKPAVVNNMLFYASSSPATGVELYRADNNGTSLVSDMIPGTQGSSPSRFFAADDVLYFSNDDITYGRELWKYDPLVDYILPPGSAQVTININEKNTAVTQQQLIARIRQAGANPLNHNVLTKVMVDPTVQTYNGQPYVQRHYDIEPEWDANNATATMTLYFTQAEFDNYNAFNPSATDNLPTSPSDAAAITRLRVLQFHGVGTAPGNYPGTSHLIDPDDDKIVWDADNNWWEVTFDVAGFSGFYVTSISGVLPVKLVSFTATKGQGQTVNLNWDVREQAKMDHYLVERSTDGRLFTPIGKVMANNLTESGYSFHDSRAQRNNYYRLKMVEDDNTYAYSQIERISFSKGEKLIVYPNPATDRLLVEASMGSERVTISLYNASGIMVLQQQAAADSVISLPIGQLPAGTYYIKVAGGQVERSAVFIKQ